MQPILLSSPITCFVSGFISSAIRMAPAYVSFFATYTTVPTPSGVEYSMPFAAISFSLPQ